MKIALCNEVIRDLEFSAPCSLAATLGYCGLEVAPFTLGENPHLLPSRQRSQLRRAALDAGISITGLHWLLLSPPGLSITDPDRFDRDRTIKIIVRLIDLCADLGGKVLVHGSPKQRQVSESDDPLKARYRARDLLAKVSEYAAEAGVIYVLEPLAPLETNFINTVDDAVQLITSIGNSVLRTMIDTCAAGIGEASSIPQLIDQWLPTGTVAHVHLNDINRLAPGQGKVAFTPILAALQRNGYAGVAAVEPFK